MTTEITHRNLFKGALLGMTGAAGAGMLAGCASKQLSTAAADSDDASASASVVDAAAEYAGKVTETEDVDIVVVGAGASGLAAAVEALNQGADVLVLESQTKAGGNGSTTSVVIGVGIVDTGHWWTGDTGRGHRCCHPGRHARDLQRLLRRRQ